MGEEVKASFDIFPGWRLKVTIAVITHQMDCITDRYKIAKKNVHCNGDRVFQVHFFHKVSSFGELCFGDLLWFKPLENEVVMREILLPHG